jgi:very-short-patch-repair endonuclease
VRGQHGVVAREQLLRLGLTKKAIDHRIARGRLRAVATGVYAVGRPGLTEHGRWMAAVLSCGPGAGLSHTDAAGLLEIRPTSGPIEVSAPTKRRRPGVVVHTRRDLELTKHLEIPVTTPAVTLVDLAARLPPRELEAAVNEAAKLDLIRPDELRVALDGLSRRPGLKTLRNMLDRHAFLLTDSDLERRFLAIAFTAGLSRPETGVMLHGFKVDFCWRDLGLVVETDGLRYHRTPSQQSRDRLRDQVLTAAGFTILRFTHAQVRYESQHVRTTLVRVARRRATGRRSPS